MNIHKVHNTCPAQSKYYMNNSITTQREGCDTLKNRVNANILVKGKCKTKQNKKPTF